MKVILRSPQHEHLLPLAIGLIEDDAWKVTGSINARKFVDGYYVLEMECKREGVDMHYTFERGSLTKTEIQ